MVVLKSSYRNNGRFKKQLEKDDNDPYYNAKSLSKQQGRWKVIRYYKYKSKAEANKIYQRL